MSVKLATLLTTDTAMILYIRLMYMSTKDIRRISNYILKESNIHGHNHSLDLLSNLEIMKVLFTTLCKSCELLLWQKFESLLDDVDHEDCIYSIQYQLFCVSIMHLLTTKLQFEPSPFYKYSHTIKFQLLDAGLHEPIKWHYMIDEKSKKKLKESHYKLLVMIGDVDLSNDKMATLEYPNGCQLSSNYQNIPILGSDKKLNIVYPGDITKTVKIDKTNQLCFRFFRIHIPLLITLSLYEEITESHLIKQLKIIRKTDNLATRMSRLKELDTDVIPGLERVSLKDPYTLCRILTPIKSIKCPHTQCYDGCTFLQMNRKIPMHAWECPICKRSIRFEELIIDEFFQHLLKSVNDDFVFINADGSLQLKVRDAPARKRRRKESGSSL